MEIRSLAKIEFDNLFKAFERAFADYELQQNKIQLQTMLKRRGFNPELSFAAFEGNEITAFTFNGIGNFNGIPTAYDTGTGTLKEYRGKGLATQVFEHSIPYLEQAGIKQYLLEVLQYNTPAVSVYSKLGFKVTREFNYFSQENKAIGNKIQTIDRPYSVQPIDIRDYDSIPSFWDFYPSWQNSFESIERTADDFICLGVFTENKLIGYCAFEPVSGDISQIAVDKPYRRKGIASILLDEMIRLNKNDRIKLINADITCISITEFMKAQNIGLAGTQFEMVRPI